MNDFDITQHIKMIEARKCALLSDVAALYERMRTPSRREVCDEQLADILIDVYGLGSAMGINRETLDALAVQRLRREALDDSADTEARGLLAYLSRRRGTNSGHS